MDNTEYDDIVVFLSDGQHPPSLRGQGRVLVNKRHHYKKKAESFYIKGLRTIQKMLGKASHELRIDVEGYDGSSGNDVYSNFRLQGAGYTFYVDNRTRSLNRTGKDELSDGSSYSPYWQKFTTFDNDQDRILNASCAQTYRGAWWYNRC